MARCGPQARRRPSHWYLLRQPIVLVPLALLSLIALGYWQYLRFVASFFGETIRDKARYPEVLKAWQASDVRGYVAHFPASIPASATGVRFYFEPGALQGSTTIELRMLLPPAQFGAELTQARLKAAAFKPIEGQSPPGHTKLWTDRGDTPPPGRVCYPFGALPGFDAWGMTLDPSTGEVAYWAIDD